jgi:hypothetical protein
MDGVSVVDDYADDYKEMYLHLFNRITDAIALLQEAQRAVEDKFLSLGEPGLRLVPPETQDEPG